MKTLKSADGEMPRAYDAIQPLSSDVQGILRDANNDVASKTFQDLPTEIRLLIWNLLIPQGRIIKVKAWAYDRPNDKYEFRLEMDDEPSIPVLFHICRETRDLVDRTFIHGIAQIRDTKRLYWNPETDIFYLNLRSLRIKRPQFSRLRTLHNSLAMAQNLGLRLGPGFWYNLTQGGIVEWLHGFPNLKYLRLRIEPRGGHGPWNWTSRNHDDADIIEEAFSMGLMPRDLSFNDARGLLAECVQRVVVQKFKEFKAAKDPEWMLPVVDVHHLPLGETSSQYES